MVKMLRNFYVAGLILVTSSSPVIAGEWWYVGGTIKEDAEFVDILTIVRDNSGVTYWVQTVIAHPLNKIFVGKTLYRDTCIGVQRTSTQIRNINYGNDGGLVSEYNPKLPQAKLIIPDSVAVDNNAFACATNAERAKLGIKVSDPESFAKSILKENTPPK
jgi:hypothetical protein